MAASLAERKRAAAEAAIGEVRAGMLVGLGTGSTAAFAIAALGERVRDGLAVAAVVTSLATEAAARAAGITVADFADVAEIDLAIDGVDEIDHRFRAIKGGGGAMLREKIVAVSARRMIAIADDSKLVDRLGGRPVPLEVLPFARSAVMRAAAELGGRPLLRTGAGGVAATTDQGNILIDATFADLADPVALAARLSAIPGMLGHGLFLSEIDALYVGTADGVLRRDKAAPTRDERRGAAHP